LSTFSYIPIATLEKVKRKVLRFIYHRRGPSMIVRYAFAFYPRERGGLGLLDPVFQQHALHGMWIVRLLLARHQPAWRELLLMEVLDAAQAAGWEANIFRFEWHLVLGARDLTHRKLYFGEQGDLPAPCPFCLEPDNFEHFALRCAAAQRDRAFTDACWQFWRPEKNLQGCWDAHFSADEQWTTFHFLLTHCRYRIRSEASINGARALWNDVVSLFRSKLAMHLTTLFRPPHPPPGASPSAPISSEWLMEGHWATQDPPVIGPYKVEVSFPPANVLYE
jgi:hypothetical protein